MADEHSMRGNGNGDSDERAQLRAIAHGVGTDPVTWEEPPANVWGRIAAQAGVEPADAGVDPVGDPDELAADAHDPAEATVDSGDVPVVVPPTRLDDRRRRPVARWVAAAAVLVAVVAGGALVFSLRADDDGTIVTATDLERLGDSGSGRAELVDRDGVLDLHVTADGIDVDDGTFAEVWLINTDVTELISLGPLRADGVYPIPAGVDPSAFPIVDVSIEPIDGDPTHSGNSVLRGQLPL